MTISMNPLLLLLILLPCLNSELNEGRPPEDWDQYDDEDLALAIPKDAVGAPADFRKKVLAAMGLRKAPNDTVSNRCYCSYGPPICDQNESCLKSDGAACFHAVEEVTESIGKIKRRLKRFDKSERIMVTMHMFGCTELERGSGASHITCNSWRASHHSPKSIKCCYEGNFCNKDLVPHEYAAVNEKYEDIEDNEKYQIDTSFGIFLKLGTLVFFFMIMTSVMCCLYKLKKKADSLKPVEEGVPIKKKKISRREGSGSDGETLIQRTVALDLQILKIIGSGRYGEVSKAMYRHRLVAVKTFYTTDEDSWRNEREIYKTDMLNHENILREYCIAEKSYGELAEFVAADIFSEDSITKMLLVTEYHELGCLADYLRREEVLSKTEMLHLINSVVCGIEHLHAPIRGTGTWKKPEIVHRDIKSRNIIVKRPGVCCIADFGLALQFNENVPPQRVKVQVGTKRYMAPEVLQDTLNPLDFSQFKMADVYSTALVMWEIAKNFQKKPKSIPEVDSGFSSNGSADGIFAKMPQTRQFEKHYTIPYEGCSGFDPSFEEMAKIVCVEGRRPPPDAWWFEDRVMSNLWRMIQESWALTPSYRLTMLNIKKEMYQMVYPEEGLEIRRKFENEKEIETDSGFQSNLNNTLTPANEA